MGRAVLVLINDELKRKAINWIKRAPQGTRVQFNGPKRSLPQSALMWSLVTSVAEQKEHFGRKYTPDQWKILFMDACGREVQFMPSLDGKTFIPWGHSSSELSKEEMSELIEFIYSWGAQNGVRFHNDPA